MLEVQEASRGLPTVIEPPVDADCSHPVATIRLGDASGAGALAGAMLTAVVCVGLLAYWDARRESEAALADLAQEQETLAVALAMDLEDRLRLTSGRSSEVEILNGLNRAQRPRANVIGVLPPGAREFVTSDHGRVALASLRGDLLAGHTSARFSREAAAALGLPARTALAGLARVQDDEKRTWGVVVVASAERERDREQWAKWRLILSVTTATGLVSAFGGLALRKQKNALTLHSQVLVANTRHQANERLQTANKAATLGTLAMGLAHEIATPLGVISLRAEQLAAQLAGEERGSAAARTIVQQCDHITQIIRGLLGLAHGGAPVAQEISPRTLVEASVAMIAHRLTQSRVTIETSSPPSLPSITGDPKLLQHALINLLLNACDASPPGSSVRVSTAIEADELVLSVVDRGAGISQENVDRVLQPFFTTKPSGQGTGLGLAVAREIVNSHRGTLTLSPESPRGTKAVIRLPLLLGHENG
jgi:two-component system NtrC family sensor kinase